MTDVRSDETALLILFALFALAAAAAAGIFILSLIAP